MRDSFNDFNFLVYPLIFFCQVTLIITIFLHLTYTSE